jgi:hypothetical protein
MPNLLELNANKFARMKLILHSFTLLLLTNTCLAQQKIFTDNTKPRLDEKGNIVDAHDGRVIQFGKTFYWYGTAYGATNGFTKANEYVCYSSTNLHNWKYEGKLLQQKPVGVYYRPHVAYNSDTKKYVLWYNWYPKLWDGQFGVAESNNPTGPFTIINDNVKVKQQALGVGDLGIFVDDDKKAYLSYNTISNHKVSVELLDETYTASTMQGSEFIAEHCEAGSMFKRNGMYYLLTDYTCCFCTQGSGAMVFAAKNPLGPYSFKQNINRYAGQAATLLHDGNKNDNWYENLSLKEGNALYISFKKISSINSLNIFQFTGDRNGQCGEVDNPILHEPIEKYDFTIEANVNGDWKKISTSNTFNQNIMQNAYQLKFANINTDEIRVTPVYKDSSRMLLIEEIEIANKKFDVYKSKKWDGGKPIIPAQQTYVMEVNTLQGKQYIWMGDLWGSASDNIKGHDYQFWSSPLQFDRNGNIKKISFANKWQLTLK